MSTKTASVHELRILAKLEVSSRVAATAAQRLGTERWRVGQPCWEDPSRRRIKPPNGVFKALVVVGKALGFKLEPDSFRR